MTRRLMGMMSLALMACGTGEGPITTPDGDAETIPYGDVPDTDETSEPDTTTDGEVTDTRDTDGPDDADTRDTDGPDDADTDGPDDADTHDTDGPETDVDTTPLPLEPLFTTLGVRDVRITLPAADWAALRRERRSYLDMFAGDCLADEHVSPFTWFRGTLVVDGVTVSDVGVRKKGWLGSVNSELPSLKVKLDKYVADQALAGHEDLILNNSVQDLSNLRQCLGYALFQAAGIPSPACGFAHLRVNDEDLGVYVLVEAVDKAFLRRRFADPGGNMYEGVFSDFRAGWLGTFEPETNAATTDKSDLHAVKTALEADDASVLGALDAVVDLDAFYTYWALENLVGHRDGYARNANNYRVWADPRDGRFRFMPHGIDAILRPEGEGAAALFLSGAALSTRLLDLPSARAALIARMGELLDTVWDTDALLAEVDRMAAMLAPHSREREAQAAQTAQLRSWIVGRSAAVKAILASSPSPSGQLAPSVCWPFIGSFSVTFEAPTNSLFAGPPGTGTLSFTLGATTTSLGTVRARAGFASTGETLTLIVTGLDADGGNHRFELALNRERLTPSSSALDGTSDITRLYRPISGMGSAFFGYGGPGTLILEQASTEVGSVLRGSATGQIFAGGPGG